MNKFIVNGGNILQGRVSVSGAKNVALKALVAACLTDEEVIIHNIPKISDFFVMSDIIHELGGEVILEDHTAKVHVKSFSNNKISLDKAAHTRTSSMFLSPLLIRNKSALIPNPGGCRLGARPIDRTVEGLKSMGAEVDYVSDDGYFHATADELHGVHYTFDKNTHTGTETLIIAGVLAKGTTVLENAAAEPEIDELIDMLSSMGAKIKRVSSRKIEIEGVPKLHGAEFTIKPDRNEIVTFAIAGIITKGDVFIENISSSFIKEFLDELEKANGGYEEKSDGMRFFYKGDLNATDVTTLPYPGFMTDWQAPWAVLMSQAHGKSTIHETVFENRFGYVNELNKMGAHIEFYKPEVSDPATIYNFNAEDAKEENYQAIRIHGPVSLHNGVVSISDLRAGASLVLGALVAKGESIIHGVNYVRRGYEQFDERLKSLGADIKVKEDNVL